MVNFNLTSLAEAFEPANGDPSNYYLFQGAGTLEEASHELFKVVPEVNLVHLAITLLSVFVVVFGLFSGFIKERLYVGEAIIATAFGVAMSGYSAGIFAPRTWSTHTDELTLELTRAVIALAVFAVGVELPRAYVLRHWKSLVMLLGPIMLLGWLVSAALMYAIIPSLEFLPALVLAAGVTPTDPILASSVVGKGKFAQEHVPAHIRHILQAESGCNDGAAFPFLYLAMFLLLRETHSVGQSIGWWVVLVVLYQILLGTIIGALVGILARKMLKFSKRRELIDRESMVAMYVALALFVTSVTTLAGSDDLLAAFACGTAFAWDDWFTESIEESNFSSTIDLLANCAIFIYVGATMPFAAWVDANLTLNIWRLVLLAAGILAFRRLPAMFALQWWIPDLKTRREALFAGHFGPMGIGAIFISTLAATKLPTPTYPPESEIDYLSLLIGPVTYFIVLSSILVHGFTISFFTLGRRVHSRVASISRTFTAQSRDTNGVGGADEPAWMSRVKRAQNRDEIVVNRDDDDSNETATEKEKEKFDSDPESLAEKGERPETPADDHKMALFSAADKGTKPLGKAEQEEQEADKEDAQHRNIERDEQREGDEHPSHNVLGDLGEDVDDGEKDKERKAESVREGRPKATRSGTSVRRQERVDDELQDNSLGAERSKDSYKEEKYCDRSATTTWRDGRKIIIEHNDGESVQVIDLDASPERAREFESDPNKKIAALDPKEIDSEKKKLPSSGTRTPAETEQTAIQNIANKKAKQGNLLTAAAGQVNALLHRKDDGLTESEREKKRQKKFERDEWCRKEQKYRDREEFVPPPTRGGRKAKAAASASNDDQEWLEGNKVVTEHPDGTTDVRELDEDERAERAARHLAALRQLGAPVEALGSEWTKLTGGGHKKGKARQTRERSVSPNRTSTPSGSALPSPSLESTAPRGGISLEKFDRIEPESDEETSGGNQLNLPQRPAPARSTSAIKAVQHLFGRGNSRSPESDLRIKRVDKLEEEQEENSTSATEPPQSSIRFAAVDRPSRQGTANSSNARPLPAVGGLGIKRTGTQSSQK